MSTSYRARLVALLLVSSGCFGGAEDAASSDDEAVLDHVEALGFDRTSAKLVGARVIVQGDLRFRRDALLRGEYERLADIDHSRALIEKGYRYPAIIATKHRSNIRLVFAKDAYEPSKKLKDAFIAAAKAWSSIPGSPIRVSTTNTGPAIVVRAIPVDIWDQYSGCDDTDACADVPLNGRPGYEVFIRKESVWDGCETWAGSNLANVTRHELGHALGFAHPREPNSKPAGDSERCTKAAARCPADPGYATIMATPDVTTGCVFAPARLTKDDYATAVATYGAQ